MSQDRHSRLRERIVALIEQDFSQVGPGVVAEALGALVEEFERRAQRGRSVPDPAATPPPAQESSNIGALMMQVDQPVKLNEFVTLLIEYPSVQFSLEITGRVVNISARGTAIEIMKLEREDRAALERLYQDYQHLVGAPDWRPSRRLKKSSPRRPPSARPQSHARAGLAHRGGGETYSRIGSTLHEPRMTVRRQVALTDPDEEVLTDSTQVKSLTSAASRRDDEEFYGPQLRWIEPQQDPDRIEELAGDRIFDILLQLSGHVFSGLLELEQQARTEDSEPVRWQLLFDAGFLVDAVRHPRMARVELGNMLLLAKRVEHDGAVDGRRARRGAKAGPGSRAPGAGSFGAGHAAPRHRRAVDVPAALAVQYHPGHDPDL